jgi:uncharacterized protein YccT (UPF0319 family)
MKFFLLIILIALTSCQTGTIKLQDRFEDHATVTVPDHVEAIEIGGRLIRSSLSFGDQVIEIPLGRTEIVFRFYKIYDVNEDDFEKMISEKMTVVFVPVKNNHYELKMPEPKSVSGAEAFFEKLKGSLLHIESGEVYKAIPGIIEERYHGIQLKRPYDEMKYWWKKSTSKEKSDFRKWLSEQ